MKGLSFQIRHNYTVNIEHSRSPTLVFYLVLWVAMHSEVLILQPGSFMTVPVEDINTDTNRSVYIFTASTCISLGRVTVAVRFTPVSKFMKSYKLCSKYNYYTSLLKTKIGMKNA